MVEIRMLRRLQLGTGYGVTDMPCRDVTGTSVFEPERAIACAGPGTSPTSGATRETRDARARPPPVATRAQTHDFLTAPDLEVL